jgi:hypothetical protein
MQAVDLIALFVGRPSQVVDVFVFRFNPDGLGRPPHVDVSPYFTLIKFTDRKAGA